MEVGNVGGVMRCFSIGGGGGGDGVGKIVFKERAAVISCCRGDF